MKIKYERESSRWFKRIAIYAFGMFTVYMTSLVWHLAEHDIAFLLGY